MKNVDKAGAGACAIPVDEGPNSDAEPRILDIRLAELLGFPEPMDIRPLIRIHEAYLSCLGELIRRGPSGTYLNKYQAAFITAKADTTLANEITLNMARDFVS